MQKKFISNLVFILFLNLLIKPFWILGIDREVLNVVGVNNYGIYFILLNFAFIFNLFLDLGLNHFNNRKISQNPQLLKKYFSTIAVLKAGLGLLFLLIIHTVGSYFMSYSDYYLYLLTIIGCNQVLLSFLLFLRSNIAGLQLFKIDSILSVLDRTIVIIICSVLLWGLPDTFEFKIEWFAYAQTVAYFIAIVVAIIAVLNTTKIQAPQFELGFFKTIMRESAPFALLNVIMMIYYKIDAVMLDYMLVDGAKQAGVYAQAYKLPEAANMFALLYATLLYPMFSKMLSKNEDITNLLILSSKLIIVPAVIATLAGTFFAFDIMDLMFNSNQQTSSEILPYLMFTFMAIAMSNVYGTLLTSKGELKFLNTMAFAGLIINILLNYLLIPWLNAKGSAIATVATQWTIIFIQLLWIKKTFQFSINLKLIGQFLTFGIVLMAVGFFLTHVNLHVFVNFLLMGLTGLVASILLKLIQPKEMIRFYKEER